jgi:hypothetical protein
VVNQEPAKPIVAQLDLPNADRLVLATPEHPEAVSTNATIRIPARCAAVVMES